MVDLAVCALVCVAVVDLAVLMLGLGALVVCTGLSLSLAVGNVVVARVSFACMLKVVVLPSVVGPVVDGTVTVDMTPRVVNLGTEVLDEDLNVVDGLVR